MNGRNIKIKINAKAKDNGKAYLTSRAITGDAGKFSVTMLKFWPTLLRIRTSPINRTRNLIIYLILFSFQKNLAALLAIAFFGASVSWSTLFSGTRGNLGIIS
jgi:hypothetical protein